MTAPPTRHRSGPSTVDVSRDRVDTYPGPKARCQRRSAALAAYAVLLPGGLKAAVEAVFDRAAGCPQMGHLAARCTGTDRRVQVRICARSRQSAYRARPEDRATVGNTSGADQMSVDPAQRPRRHPPHRRHVPARQRRKPSARRDLAEGAVARTIGDRDPRAAARMSPSQADARRRRSRGRCVGGDRR